MKKALFFLSLLLLFVFPSCVKESPEPVYVPEIANPEDRELLYTEEVSFLVYGFYSDNTAELLEVSPEDTRDTLALPETVKNHTLVAIGKDAFKKTSYTEITLPDTIKEIGEHAFQRSLIESIHFPDSLTKIDKEAFDNCLRLKKITFGSGLKEISLGCFFGCSAITELSLPEGVESIAEEAFASMTALKTLSLPSSFRVIGPYAFWNSGEAPLSVTIPKDITSIGEEAFAGSHSHNFRYDGDNAEVKSALGLN